MAKYLALDIGGTKIKSGIVTSDGKVLATYQIPSRRGCTLDEMLADMLQAVKPYASNEIAGVGVGFPGRGDFEAGVLQDVPLFPCLNGFPILDRLQRTLSLPVRMAVDAEMFALGVRAFGEGREYPTVVCLTLGTGIGIGVISEGRVVEGAQDWFKRTAGDHGSPVPISGYFIEESYGSSAEVLFRRAMAGDPTAINVFDSMGDGLAGVIGRAASEYRCDAVILGGGLSGACELFWPSMTESLGHVDYEVMVTALSKPAMLGAATLFEGDA